MHEVCKVFVNSDLMGIFLTLRENWCAVIYVSAYDIQSLKRAANRKSSRYIPFF